MSLQLLDRAMLVEDLPAEGLRAGDVGVVVETVAVVSVPATAVRVAESHELLAVRSFRAS